MHLLPGERHQKLCQSERQLVRVSGTKPKLYAAGQVWVCLNEPALPLACGGSSIASGSGSGSSSISESGSGSYSGSSSSSSGAGGGDSDGGGYGGGGDLACFVFNERAQRFLFWDRNSSLRLAPALTGP